MLFLESDAACGGEEESGGNRVKHTFSGKFNKLIRT
jgi:hypothetical protein